MTTNGPSRDPLPPRSEPDVGEQNLARLIGRAYQPERPDAAFVAAVHQRLQAVARDAAAARRQPGASRLRRLWPLAAAAALLGVMVGLHALLSRPADGSNPALTQNPTAPAPSNMPVKPSDEAPAQQPWGDPGHIAQFLTPRQRPAGAGATPAAVGDTLATAAGERRRFALPDGSLLYLNQNATARVVAPREVALDRGEVFVEVSPREPGRAGATFLVRAAGREVAALGTKFAVRAADAGPAVVVTQGKVQVSGVGSVVAAGEELPPGGERPAPAPRASYTLDWVRDLIAAADSPLVPASDYRGGALVARGPDGRDARITLRKYRVDVHVEDGFVRTTIDQTYFNEEWARLEGQFFFPLPADAQLSRLAMYVNGRLMEGGMVERQEGQTIYKSIVTKMKDPALLEWIDGTTFSMRVFPLEKREEKRIVLSYTQKLPTLYGRSRYRFPAGHSLGEVREWSFHAVVKHGAKLDWSCDSHKLTATTKDGDLILDAEAKDARTDRDVVLELNDTAAGKGDLVRFSSAEADGAHYLMLRYRPELPGQAKRQRRDWVFLFESSAQRDPLLARVQVDVVKTLLANAEHDDTFHLLAAGAAVHAFTDGPLPVTRANVDAAVAWLEGTHLVGGIDLKQALDAAAERLRKADNPYLVHVGGGLPTLGERRDDALAQRLPEAAHYVGVAVGKRWNRGFMKLAAERSGGLFTQINPDEPVAWRAFDLYCTLCTPRLVNVQVVDDAEKAVFLCHDTTLSQGEELCAVARVADGELPRSVSVSALLDGKPFRKTLAVADVAKDAGYLPRTWAKLEIDRLLAQDAAGNKPRVIELSKAMYVMTPYTSLLVLEDEAMYARYHVDRGRKDHWAMYDCPPTIRVYHETSGGPAAAEPVTPFGRRPVEDVARSVVLHLAPWPPAPAGAVQAGGVPSAQTYSGFTLYYAAGGDLSAGWGLFPVPDVCVPAVDPTPALGTPFGAAAVPGVQPAYGSFPPGGYGHPGGGLGGFGGGRGQLGGGFGQFGGGGFTGGFGGGGGFGYSPGPGGPPAGGTGAAPGFGGAGGMRPVNPSPPGTPPMGATGGASPPLSAPTAPPPAPPGPSGTPTYSPMTGGGPGGGMAPPPGGGPPRPLGGVAPGQGLGTFGGYAPSTPTGAPTELPVAATPLPPGFGTTGPGPNSSLPLALPRPEELLTQFRAPADVADQLATHLMSPVALPSPLYQWPHLASDQGLYTNLLGFAPGLHNGAADLLAVLEAEAVGYEPSHGRVDPEARALVEKARQTDWQRVTFLTPRGQPSWSLVCDGGGRFAWERTLATGLKEQVVCDGRQMWHVYPELGLAARRSVSRFHMQELTALVPWVLPPVDDLAIDADVKLVGPDVVAVVPRSGGAELHLVFGPDGRLTERRLVERGGRELARESLDAAALAGRMEVKPATAPDLKPNTRTALVLSLPVRTREEVVRRIPAVQANGDAKADAETALALFLAECPHPSEGVTSLLVDRWGQRPDVRRGLTVLLASARPDWDGVLSVKMPGNDAATKYLFWARTPHARPAPETQLKPGDGFLARLQTLGVLAGRWADDRGPVSDAEANRVLEFVRSRPGPALVWLAADYGLTYRTGPFVRRLLEEAARSADGVPALEYALRYEAASLLRGSAPDEARRAYLDAYRSARAAGLLPPVDQRLRESLGGPAWADLAKETGRDLLKRGQCGAVLTLARQCVALGDPALADGLAGDLVEAAKATPAWPAVAVAAAEYYWHANQPEEAAKLLDRLLADPTPAARPKLWRLRAWVESERAQGGRPSPRFFEALERALDLEYPEAKGAADPQAVRHDYGLLLGHYRQLAEAHATLQQPAPRELVARTVRAADRWRSLDPDAVEVCRTAARVLKSLGQDDLAWDYLTTPLRGWTPEQSDVLSLARELVGEGDLKTAARAYRSAAEADPENYAVFWERVETLKRAGQAAEARALTRALAEDASAPAEQRERARREANER